MESYDSYEGVREMMPLAKGVSVKPKVWDFNGNNTDIDLLRMMKIVVDSGYHGHAGIESGTGRARAREGEGATTAPRDGPDHVSARSL